MSRISLIFAQQLDKTVPPKLNYIDNIHIVSMLLMTITIEFFLHCFATFLQPPPPTFLQTPYKFPLNPKP